MTNLQMSVEKSVMNMRGNRVIHQKNGGLSVVRNVGFEQAKGEWICFADGDDWMEKDALTIGANLLDTTPPDTDIVICEAYISTPEGEKENYFLGRKTTGNVFFSGEKKEELIDLFFPRYNVKREVRVLCDIGSTWARFYRKSFVIENNLKNVPGLRRTQDNIFNLYAIDKARVICYNCQRIYHYRIRQESVSNKYDKKIIKIVLRDDLSVESTCFFALKTSLIKVSSSKFAFLPSLDSIRNPSLPDLAVLKLTLFPALSRSLHAVSK